MVSELLPAPHQGEEYFLEQAVRSQGGRGGDRHVRRRDEAAHHAQQGQRQGDGDMPCGMGKMSVMPALPKTVADPCPPDHFRDGKEGQVGHDAVAELSDQATTEAQCQGEGGHQAGDDGIRTVSPRFGYVHERRERWSGEFS